MATPLCGVAEAVAGITSAVPKKIEAKGRARFMLLGTVVERAVFIRIEVKGERSGWMHHVYVESTTS